ncbi:MAG: hypothetical protein R3C03_15685 [Pirellulaceae bacterium]
MSTKRPRTTLQVDKERLFKSQEARYGKRCGCKQPGAMESAPGFGSGPEWEAEVLRRNQEKQIAASNQRIEAVSDVDGF